MLSAVDYVILWLRAYAVRVARGARRIWKWATSGELFNTAWLIFCMVLGITSAALGTDSWSTAFMLSIAFMIYLDLLNETTRTRLHLWHVMRETPGGAPMAMVVDCTNPDNGEHRLAYTDGAWQEIK